MANNEGSFQKLLLTTKEAAKVLGVSSRTISNLVREGKIPTLKILGSRRFPLDRLKTWISNKEEK